MRSLLTLAIVSVVWWTGCRKSEEDLASKTGEKVGEALTGFAEGFGKGMDKQMTVKAELSPALAEQGISMTVAKSTALDLKPEPPAAPASRPATIEGRPTTIETSPATSAPSPKASNSKHKGITVYLVAARPFKATLIAKALNKDGQEVGRSTAEVDFAADEAQYVTFGFPDQMDTQLVEKYVIDVKK